MPLAMPDTGANAALELLGAEAAHALAAAAAPAGEEAPPLPPRSAGPVAALGARLGLTLFETDVLAFAIGVEVNAEIAALAGQAAGDPRASFASFGVALAAFEDADWAATAPHRPLRRLRLVSLTAPDRLIASELRVDERVLHALFGADGLDARLTPYLRPLVGLPRPAARLGEHARRVTAHLGERRVPGVVLTGRHAADLRLVTAAAAGERPVWCLAPADLPAAATERETFARLWEREARLTGALLLVEAEGEDQRLTHLLADQPGPIVLAGQEPPAVDPAWPVLAIPAPDRSEQADLWRRALGGQARRMNGAIDTLTQTFDLGEAQIGTLAAKLGQGSRRLEQELWEACRGSARPRLGQLAQRIEAVAGWDDLVLPADALATLRTLTAQVRHRHRVYGDWGFGGKSNRGLGISALFAGPSGTGKTMAAEVIARALDLDLYRIDLSAVVSKYIGETEKNLRALFDAAEGSGAILLFDEADALFGKRSEVSDAHDRYANIEVSYLLQRMEAYAGLAILTTNMRSALDEAFVRRIRFAVTFPFPNYAARLRVWQGVFPAAAEHSDLAWEKLARLELTPGHIRNVAVN
ncbi:MAG: ATP-binding protein, partial [Alphaproteobacteria bacterium]|nr:ATP-binding protein [Alphaproteobacteria bacterium]